MKCPYCNKEMDFKKGETNFLGLKTGDVFACPDHLYETGVIVPLEGREKFFTGVMWG
jgi:hypothetical protein